MLGAKQSLFTCQSLNIPIQVYNIVYFFFLVLNFLLRWTRVTTQQRKVTQSEKLRIKVLET